MKAPFFRGSFPLTVDSKNRLLVPSKIRKIITPELGETLIVTRRAKTLWMYPVNYYEQVIRQQVVVDIKPTPEMLDYLHLRLALSDEVEWDGQGRVVLPAHQLRQAEIKSEVTLIGMVDHLELWSRELWLGRTEKITANEDEIEKNFKPANLNAISER